jgi:acetolactate synthase-1/3 small subunit
MEKKPYIISTLVENIPGVLSQVSRLFSRKGYNIENIASGATLDPGVNRITVVILADELMIKQITGQLNKLLPVISVKVLDGSNSIQRELVMVKVKADSREERDDIIQIANVFKASILDMSEGTMTLAVARNEEKTNALLKLLEDFDILEVVRTGMIAIERGRNTINDPTKDKEEYNYGKNVL